MFFELQLVVFFEDLRSERRLMRVVADRLSVRWYLGYDLHEPLPDRSSLARIRERYDLPVFRRFLERIVEMCVEAGPVWRECRRRAELVREYSCRCEFQPDAMTVPPLKPR